MVATRYPDSNSVHEDAPLAVLLATYHGERFVEEQLLSIAEQTRGQIDIYVSDDSATSTTAVLIDQIVSRMPHVRAHFLQGPQKGYVENFRSLVLNVDPAADYIAFSDQDDIWLSDKTSRAVQWLCQQPVDVPALYCGRTRMIDESGVDIGRLSPLFKRAPGFENALLQSIAGGNTMTMNRAAFDLLKRSLVSGTPISHDWWCYIMITGAGGRIFYDAEPLTLYRQHGDNLIGENQTLAARKKRIKMILSGVWKEWQDTNLALIRHNLDEFTDGARKTLDLYAAIRGSSLWRRLTLFSRSRLRRQTRTGTASLFIAVLLNKL